MSNADQLAIASLVESTFGVAPSGTWPRMRITGETLAQTADYIQSNELDSTRQVADVILTSTQAGGNVDFELSYGGASSAFDNFLQRLLFSTGWSSEVQTTGAFSTVSATKTVSGTGVSVGMAVGQWVRLEGFSATVDGYYKIATIPGTTSFTTVQTIAADTTGGGDETVTMGAQIINGTTFASFAIEREFTDNTNDFALSVGLGLQQMSLNTAIDALLTGQFQFLGKSESSETSATPSGYTAAPTNPVMNAVDHVVAILEDGSQIDLSEFTLQLNNNLRGRKKISTRGPFSMGAGKFSVTGSLNGYYDGPTRINRFFADTPGSFAIVLDDSGGVVGNGYIIELPYAKLTESSRNASGTNTDVMNPVSFTAYRHPTELITTRISRFTAV